MRVIEHTTHIAADATAIYDIIVDIESYDEWNPFNPGGRGTPQVGGPLITITADLAGRRLDVQHKILEMVPGRAFKWCDTGAFTYFAYGERGRYMEPSAEGGTDYRVRLEISGILAWLAYAMFGSAMEEGVVAETDALKRRAEARTA